MQAKAAIVHQLPQRVRLRILDRRNDDVFFDETIEKLSSMKSITQFHTNRTASSVVLIHEETEWPEVLDELEGLQLLTIVETPVKKAKPVMAPMIARMKRYDRNLDEVSLGSMDLQTVAFIALLLLTLRQASQGHVLGPALPMLMHAWSLARRFNVDEGDGSGK